MKTFNEDELYRMALSLIKKYFPGLKPRPVKIDNTIDDYAQASEPSMLFNLNIHRSKREVIHTLKHELIHYELRDKGLYPGHGRAFLKRAKELKVVDVSELRQCSGIEEIQFSPHTVTHVKTPLAEFAAGIGKQILELKKFAIKLPIDLRLKFYRIVRSIEVDWICYRGAAERGENHIQQEIWKLRRGPKGKPLVTLLEESKALQDRIDQLYPALEDPKARKEIARLESQLDRIAEKLKRDYNMDPY